MEFDIHIDDGSTVLPSMVVEQNSDSLTLYDWQRRAIDFFLKHKQVIFEVTTGAGKTYCAISIIKKILEIEPKCKILIIVPKNVIMETTWYKELYEFGIPIPDIGVYYGPIKELTNISITNMQSVHRIPLDMFDFVIYDELHNYGTERMLEFVKHTCKYKIGLSATMERMDGNHWKLYRIFDFNVFKYKPKEALFDGILNPFDFFNIGIHLDDESMGTYEELTNQINTIMSAGGGFSAIMRTDSPLKKQMLSKMNERKDLVNNYPLKFEVAKQICQNHIGEKTLIFNQYNKQTSKLYWHLLDVGVKSQIIHSDLDKEVREQNLIDFKLDKFDVLLTTKVLDEGYNLPKISVAVIMAGDSTARQTIQRMGRVLRKKKKKSILYQVYCINTIEQTQGEERAKLFKDLCSNYGELIYNGVDLNLGGEMFG